MRCLTHSICPQPGCSHRSGEPECSSLFFYPTLVRNKQGGLEKAAGDCPVKALHRTLRCTHERKLIFFREKKKPHADSWRCSRISSASPPAGASSREISGLLGGFLFWPPQSPWGIRSRSAAPGAAAGREPSPPAPQRGVGRGNGTQG